jgi:rubrerythrin
MGRASMSKIRDLEEIAEIISIAIRREQASIKYYERASNKAKTESAKDAFSLLLEQERGHEARLRAQLHEIKAAIEFARMKSQ